MFNDATCCIFPANFHHLLAQFGWILFSSCSTKILLFIYWDIFCRELTKCTKIWMCQNGIIGMENICLKWTIELVSNFLKINCFSFSEKIVTHRKLEQQILTKNRYFDTPQILHSYYYHMLIEMQSKHFSYYLRFVSFKYMETMGKFQWMQFNLRWW